MGACQGRTCGAAAKFLFGWDAAMTNRHFSHRRK
jgi:hypothetical protein